MAQPVRSSLALRLCGSLPLLRCAVVTRDLHGTVFHWSLFMALQNLASWNPSNPECLLLVVKELVQQYHQFQCGRLRESSRLMFEYQTLLEEPQYGENMEIYAGKKNNWVSAER